MTIVEGLKKADLLSSTENAVGVTGVRMVSYGVRNVSHMVGSRWKVSGGGTKVLDGVTKVLDGGRDLSDGVGKFRWCQDRV